MAISKNDLKITSLNDWGTHASPKSSRHWSPGRSAMELARAWLEVTPPSLPPEIVETLATNPAFSEVRKWNAEPEARTPFDKLGGEPRNCDLSVLVEDRDGPFLIAVEGKADERFADSVETTLCKALERKLANPRSKGIARVELLAASLLGPQLKGEMKVGSLRYQLLTATAGAIAEGQRRNCGRVIMLVHEFFTSKTKEENHKKNAADLDAFVKRLSHSAICQVLPNELQGPIRIESSELFPDPPALFIGKAVRRVP